MEVTYYLQFASFIAFFRVFIYIINFNYVTKCKISSFYWKQNEIKEISFQYTKLIFLFMLFKGIIFIYSSFLKNNNEKFNISLISFIFDLYLWLNMIYYKLFPHLYSYKVILPATNSAFTVQSIITLSFIIFYFFT